MGKGKHHLRGPKKRTKEEDEAFESAFQNLLMEITTVNHQAKEN